VIKASKPFHPPQTRKMNAQLAASCLGLSLTLYDMYLTRKEEKTLIWRSPFRLTVVKTLYILSRYLGLICQMYSVARSAYWKYRYITVPRHSCANPLIFKTLGSQCPTPNIAHHFDTLK
ncbi:hypothetical protein MPER_01915, partial [Moniliophthora perniciosa FA553]